MAAATVGSSSRPGSATTRTGPSTYALGTLCFDADFECANLDRVNKVDAIEYDLLVRHDTRNPRHRLWFNFRVTGARNGQRAIFNVLNLSKSKSLFRDGNTPVVRSTSRRHWHRLPPSQVFYYRKPPGAKKAPYVLSFAFVFDSDTDAFEFAYSYPYSVSRLETYLAAMDRTAFVSRECIGLTKQRRRLDMLTITAAHNANPACRPRENTKVVFVTSRVHPGETPASFVCQGLIDYLISDEAAVLREQVIFKVIPMLNPDGVFHGNYRCSSAGTDLNRCWAQPTEDTHPTIVATKAQLVGIRKDDSLALDFFLDIHGHTALPCAFMYGNAYDDPLRMEAQWEFPQTLSSIAEEFSLAQTLFNNDKAKAGTGRRSLGGLLNPQAQCYTLEVSCYGFLREGHVVPFTERGYVQLGNKVGQAFSVFYALET
eukprot:m.147929 g.147929  ORF g.147929 m.147929 type:complete len:428 (+) comp17301_c1_seq3:364-1647(+)